MKITPRIVLANLEEYLDLFNFKLSEGARKALNEVEEFAYKCDNPSNYNLFFSKAIQNSNLIQKVFENFRTKPDLIALKLEKDYYRCIDKIAKYNNDSCGYLEIDCRHRIEKASIIDIALEYAVKGNRNILQTEDIFLAAMEDYGRILQEDDSHWVDKRLNKSDITFSHVCGYYDDNLDIKFEDIKEAILYNKYNIDIKAA
ncbi:MAG: hypothetical protein ACTH0S_09175 [Senegalia sp. (in: firmicutes)]